MPVTVTVAQLGDLELAREVQLAIEHVLANYPGEWRASIVGSQANDRWVKVFGPNLFERTYILEGAAGEHRPETIRAWADIAQAECLNPLGRRAWASSAVPPHRPSPRSPRGPGASAARISRPCSDAPIGRRIRIFALARLPRFAISCGVNADH
jgi:hypothetical protein